MSKMRKFIPGKTIIRYIPYKNYVPVFASFKKNHIHYGVRSYLPDVYEFAIDNPEWYFSDTVYIDKNGIDVSSNGEVAFEFV